MKATICKTYTFSAAHLLPNHAGKCKNLHGHNYKIEVRVHGTVKALTGESDEGMVFDFAELDAKVKPFIEAADHSLFLLEPNRDIGTRVLVLGTVSTAENIAAELLSRLHEFWSRRKYWIAVRVWETEKAWAEVTSDDI